jgi:NADH dehydrogenase
VFQSGKFALKGFPAWAAHRGYHGLAMPSYERKIRVVTGWANNMLLGRDIASLDNLTRPRAAFEEFASRPKPAPEVAAEVAAPAAAPAAAADAPSIGQPAGEPGPAYANPADGEKAAEPVKKAPAKRAPRKTTAAKASADEKAPAAE